jgi:integrase/recombinase XerD
MKPSIKHIPEGAAKAYLEISDVEAMEAAATNVRDRLLIRLLFHLGCRISEALALQVKDIDFVQEAVTIEHLKTRMKLSCPQCGTRLGKSHSFCPGCGEKVEEAVTKEKEHRRMRTLPLDCDTLELLQDYIERGGAMEKNGKKLIFGINRHRAWQIIRECANKANLPQIMNAQTGRVHKVSPHKLRDAFAVRAVKRDDSGDGLRLLQEQLGHASFDTTAKYRKVSGQELKDWYQRLWSGKENPDGAETP